MIVLATALTVPAVVSTSVTATGAYLAACKIESIWARVLGIGYLACRAFLLLLLGLTGDVLAVLLGLACGGAALHAWWYTRV